MRALDWVLWEYEMLDFIMEETIAPSTTLPFLAKEE